eukprot:gene30368-36692_t
MDPSLSLHLVENFLTNVPLDSAMIPALVAASAVILARGSVRAVSLALHSKLFRRMPVTPSIRTEDLAKLNYILKTPTRPQNYTVVFGPKGVGKSLLVDTATAHQFGVFNVDTWHSQTSETIVKEVLNTLTANRLSLLFDPTSKARRVLFFYRLLPLPPPLCVLRIRTSPGSSYAEPGGIYEATRKLRDEFGLRVIVEGPESMLGSSILGAAGRGCVVSVSPMSREALAQLPQLQELMDILRQDDLFNIAWDILGGIPTDWEQMLADIRSYSSKKSPKSESSEAKSFLIRHVMDAASLVEWYNRNHNCVKPVLAAVAESPALAIAERDGLALLKYKDNVPLLGTVLSKQMRGDVSVFVPATGAIAIALKFHIDRYSPSLQQLRGFAREINVCQKRPLVACG